MEQEVVDHLYTHSQLDIYQTLHNLTGVVEVQIQTGYQYDNIPAYCKNINLMTHLLTCIKKNNVTSPGHSLASICRDIINKVCYPVLRWVFPSRDSRENVLVLLGSINRLTAICTTCDVEIRMQVLEFIKVNMETFLLEKPLNSDLDQSGCIIDMYSSCEMLRHVLQKLNDANGSQDITPTLLVLREIFDTLIQTLDLVLFDTVGSVFIPTLTKLLDIDKEHQHVYLNTIWTCIQTFSNISGERKHYLFLCGFANYFFPVSGKPIGVDIRREDKLWEILQTGLLSKLSLNRKRCLYLVKRIVDICEKEDNSVCTDGHYPLFWWRPDKKKELTKVWEDFMLLAEVFEEKQIHVIKPLLPRMKNLIGAAAVKENGVQPYLHTSWLTMLLTRCSHHESLQIIRWSTDTVLTLDFSACPYFEQGQDKYLSGAVLDTLHEPKLFLREPGSPMGSLPVTALRLERFFTNCWKCLSADKRGSFFCKVLQNICGRDWGPYSLLFICRGLSLVPSSPCLNRETIVSIRKLLTGQLVSLEAYLRGVTLCYVVETVIHLTDKSLVSVDDFMQMLAVVDREVCIQRGTTLWSSCVDWLKEEVEEKSDWSSVSIKKNIEVSLNKYLETSLDSSYSLGDQAEALVLARQLLLASDAVIATEMNENQSSCLIHVLERLTTIINSVNTHAYMSQHKADKAVQLLVLIVQEMEPARCKPDDPIFKLVMASVTCCQEELSTFVARQMKEGLVADMGLLEMYVSAVKMLTVAMDTTPCVHLRGLVKMCTAVLDMADPTNTSADSKMKELSAICILGMFADFLSHDKFLRSQEVRSDVRDLRDSISSFASRLHLNPPNMGRMTSMYLQNQWRIVRLALLSSTTVWCEPECLLNQSTEALAVGLNEASLPIMQAIKLTLPYVLSKTDPNTDTVVLAMDACMASLMEVGRSVMFGHTMDAFAEVIFQRCLLMQDEESPITQKLKQFSGRLMDMSERQGVVHALARQMFKAFSHPGMCRHALKYMPLIKDLCLHGGIQTRGHRQTFDICAACEGMGERLAVNQILPVLSNQDVLARAVTVNFLCTLDPADETHCCLATGIVRLCIEHYKTLPLNAFANSLVHLQRNRLVQTVLLLEACMKQDYVTELWNFVWTALQQELQPSIRHMLEWIAMWLMYRYDHLAKQLWVLFDKYQETKNIIVCSLLYIVTHMGPHLPGDQQEAYYENSLSKILPWCLAHHFNTRIFAQATIVKLWKQCKTLGLPNILKAHSILNCLVDFNQQNKNSTKNVKKLLDSFFFKFLDFRKDFSLETVFYLLPMITSITEEDWIRPELFKQTNPDWERGTVSKFIQLRNTTDHISNCDANQLLWKYKTLRIEDELDNILGGQGEGDVQKKIMPWKQMVPDEETALEIEHGVKPKRDDGLVVVTSLINKVPNLGGLCRTSEIFGVSEYVMGSMKYLEDKLFQSLSVTAQNWLPITEVHESKLVDYLQQKRQEGYCLVGVEQTANSVCLTEYKFPRKTLLLLGNEREGIPVDLISHLDVCVEIPQQGVVRSLNVHVSGALLIWEYWRQQLTNIAGTVPS